jgi:hypothetical protein
MAPPDKELKDYSQGAVFSSRLTNPSIEIQSEKKFAQEIVNPDGLGNINCL